MEVTVKTQLKSHKFISFFKNPKNDVDFYEDIVSKNLNDNLLVESWGRPLSDDTD